MVVIGVDGRAICDFPAAPGRRGTYYGDRDYFRGALAGGKPYIGKPILGRALKRPVLTIGVPVVAADGKTRAVLTGITDLTAPNFLGLISDRAVVGDGEIFVLSLGDNMIIAATDAQRTMTPLPGAGVNAMKDRFFAGYEGSGIGMTSRGASKLMSAKRLASTDWLVEAAIPTDTAFQPLELLRTYLYATAAVLTLLAVLLIFWIARRVLIPLERASIQLDEMSSGRAPLVELTGEGDSEVRGLITSFNRLTRNLRGLAAHQEAIREDERKHIAHEIHDELGQLLTALKMDIALLRWRSGADASLQERADSMRAITDRAIDVVRHVASNLRPATLDLGLVAAIQWLAEDFSHRWEIACRVDVPNEPCSLDEAQSTAAFRLVQESLTNAARHSRASEVTIALQQRDDAVIIEIRDNGIGFEPTSVRKREGFGLYGMRERALGLGGSIRFDSAPGRGTCVRIELPRSSAAAVVNAAAKAAPADPTAPAAAGDVAPQRQD